MYSRVPNKRDGWNKRDGGTFPSKSINVMFLINVMVLNKVSYHHVFLFTAIYFLIRRDGRKFFSQRNKRAARLLGSLEYMFD